MARSRDTSEAFFSYVRSDDEHDGGYLTELRKKLAAEVRMQTGKDFVIFQDREDVLWGERWKSRIERSIDGTTLLIAVITPAFLHSEACRSEVNRFLERERQLERDDLILPLYYVEAEGLGDESDAIAVQLKSRQYIDWRPLRFDSFDQPSVRRQIASVAQQIVKAIERTPEGVSMRPTARPATDDETVPGFVELVAEAEEAFPLFNATIRDFGSELQRIGEIVQARADAMKVADKAANPARARLGIVQSLAKELNPLTKRLSEVADEYREQIARVDGGVRAIATRIRERLDADSVEAAKEFYSTVTDLAAKSSESFDTLAQFSHTVRAAARLSSTVRPGLTRVTQAAEKLISTKGVFQEWARDLEEALNERNEAG